MIDFNILRVKQKSNLKSKKTQQRPAVKFPKQF